MGDQLAEASAVPLLRPWLQSQQVVVGEPFQSFLVGSTGTPATVEAMMLIEKLGEELLGGGLGGGIGGSPDLLPMVLEPDPIGRTALVDGCHVPVLASW